MADRAPERKLCGGPPRIDLRQAESWLRKAETDLEAMSKMASELEGGPANALNLREGIFHVMSLASQVVDLSLKSAMLRLRGLTEEELAGHHFSVLHRRLRHAAARHTEASLPGDVCDMEWLKGIYLATHPSPSSVCIGQCQSIKDARRAGALARETVRWVRALAETLTEIPRNTPPVPTNVTNVEPMAGEDHQSSRSYGNDFEDESPRSIGEPMEAWVAPETRLQREVSGTMASQTEPEECLAEDTAAPLHLEGSSKGKGFFRASNDALDGLQTVVQYTNMARRLRAKGLIPRAIRMMERAVMIAQRFGQENPALALEACKVRLNFAAYLSEGFRNREAIKIIKEAQESLERLVQWAAQCPREDAEALGQEARTLHCCTVVAEAMALDLLEEDGKPLPDEISEKLKDMVRVTMSSLTPDHPLQSLVRRALGSSRSGKRSLGKPSGKLLSRMVLAPFTFARGDGPFAPQPVEELPETPETPSKKSFEEAPSRRKRGPEEKQDVFKEFLREIELARVAHLLSLSDDWEMQARKKLENFRRRARFELELVADELKEKRYSQQGHKVFMQQMRKLNKSASDPSIRRTARKEKTAPETVQLKKLSRKIKIYAKPPPPSPPPRPPTPKPKDPEQVANVQAMSPGLRGDHGNLSDSA